MKFLCKNNKDHNRFIDYGGSTTLMGWDRKYDKDGKLLNRNPNTFTNAYKCEECNSMYLTKTRLGITEFLSQDDYQVFHTETES